MDKKQFFYQKKINLGRFDYDHTDREDYSAIIEIKLENPERPELSICGEIIQTSSRRCQCAGQCYEEIANALPHSRKVARIVEVWQEYHLNGMHPECEHQRAAGWREEAAEEIDWTEYALIYDISKKQDQLKEMALEQLKRSGSAQVTEEQQKIICLPYFTRHPTKYGEENYEVYKSETQTRGWVQFKEDERGLLGKPCPVCGYGYGGAWQYMPIPPEIIEEIKSW